MPADNRTVLNELEDQNRENVILGLECCAKGSDCRKCPYYNRYRYGNINECTARLADDALALMEEQDAEVELCDRCGRIRLKSTKEGR